MIVPRIPHLRHGTDRFIVRVPHAHRLGQATRWQMFVSLMLLKWLRMRLAWALRKEARRRKTYSSRKGGHL
jgi:hypothetical protein